MPTLSTTIRKGKPLSDGSYRIYISLAHNGNVCYFATRYSIQSLTQWHNGSVARRADANITNLNLRSELNDYQTALDTIRHTETMTCSELKERLSRAKEHLNGKTYSAFCNEYIEELICDGREKYATMLALSRDNMTECFGDILLSEIDTSAVAMFQSWLRKKRKVRADGTESGRLSESTIAMRLSQVKAVVNRAISLQEVRYDVHPFVGTKIRRSAVKECSLSIEDFNRIRTCEPTSRKTALARDMFMLSFYLGGINLIDLLGADLRGTEVTFVRTKTRNRTSDIRKVTLPIVSQARDIIVRYIRSDGRVDTGYSLSYHNLSCYIGRGLSELADALDIASDVVYYSARKSFAQYACDLGIPDSIVDYCLGHSDSSRGVIRHYAKVKVQSAAKAIRKVCEYVENPSAFDVW